MLMHKMIQSCELPQSSLLWKNVQPGDFIDCYTIPAIIGPRNAAEIITDFPIWARALVKLRGVITAPFGLLVDGPDDPNKVGPFPVEIETEEELVAGFNDKHLNFRVSVISKEGNISLATWVHVHNWGGRLYLFCILPFHVLIAKNALRRVAM